MLFPRFVGAVNPPPYIIFSTIRCCFDMFPHIDSRSWPKVVLSLLPCLSRFLLTVNQRNGFIDEALWRIFAGAAGEPILI